MARVSERPRILIAEPDRFSPEAVRCLEAAGDVVLEASTGGALAAAFQRYDVVWMRLAQRVDAGTLGPAPRCRILAIPATGLDHVDLDACAARGIEVISLKGETAFLREVRATAELAVGLALALMRKVPAAAAAVRDGVWDRDRFEGHELYRKTAGVVGVGRLGSIVAQLLGAFGMRVLGYDPRPDVPDVVTRVPTLEALLEQSDLVTLHVVYEPATHGLISADALARMKPSAYLVNTSRGGIVDEAALLAALDGGRIAGAALDVLASEPAVSPDDPLIAYARRRDNLLLVPHIGGKTTESMAKTELFVAERVVAALMAARS